jgi:ABC-type sugar transport system ATPase subunit
MAGVYQPDAGELLLDEAPLHSLTPRAALARGIYLVPQEPSLLPHLSVTENLFVGTLQRRHGRVDWARMRAEAGSHLEQLGLDLDPQLLAGQLSIAQQQLLECARALVHRCRVIFFDEPTSPLTTHEAERLFRLMRRLRDEGFTLGFISHRLDEVTELSDRVTVLRDGRVVAGFERGGADRRQIVEAMVGHEVASARRAGARRHPTGGRKRLAVEGLTAAPWFSDISFTVHEGEIVGLAGLVGSGRTEIAETIFGLRRETAGTVRVAGRILEHRSPRKCIEAGLVYLPEDRARHGIFPDVEIVRNVTAGIVGRLPRRLGLISSAREREIGRAGAARTEVRAASLAAAIKTLSGGNQQRAMFARWLLAEPAIAIFDEPTRGVDVGAKEDLYGIIDGLARDGLACCIISSELEELTLLCDRVVAIYEGRVVGELVGEAITTARLGRLIVGATRP